MSENKKEFPVAKTVGELKNQLANYPDDMQIGWSNQPPQFLFEFSLDCPEIGIQNNEMGLCFKPEINCFVLYLKIEDLAGFPDEFKMINPIKTALNYVNINED